MDKRGIIALALAAQGVIPLVFGGFLFVGSVYEVHSTETTQGVVVSSTLDKKQVDDPDSADADPRYRPKVVYQYKIDGEAYQRTNVFPSVGDGTTWGDRSWAKSVVERYPERRAATVHYDPANPSDSFLVVRYGWIPLVFCLVGLALSGGGGWYAYRTYRRGDG